MSPLVHIPSPPVLTRAVGLWKVSRYSGSGPLLDLSGRGHDFQLGSTSGADSNDPLFLPFAGTKHVYFPGTAGNAVTVTLSAATTYDYTVAYEGGGTATGSVTSDGSGLLTFGGTDVKFAGLKVVTIQVVPSGGGGTLALFDASLSVEPHASFTGAFGKLWTLLRSTTGRKLAVVDRSLMLLGVDDYLETPDHADFNYAANDPFSWLLAIRHYGTPTISTLLLSKVPNFTSRGYSVRFGGMNSVLRVHDGTALVDRITGATTSGVVQVHGHIRDGVAKTLEAALDGSYAATGADTTTQTLSNTNVLRIGRHSGGGTQNGEFEFVAAAALRPALLQPEWDKARRELLAA